MRNLLYPYCSVNLSSWSGGVSEFGTTSVHTVYESTKAYIQTKTLMKSDLFTFMSDAHKSDMHV